MRYMIKFLVLALIAIVVPAQATQNVVYPFGRVDVTVPVNQFINVASYGASVKVLKQVGGPANSSQARFTPDTTVTGGIVTNREVTFGAYSVATVIRIEAGADPAFYSVGALAAALPVLKTSPALATTQLDPATMTDTASILASQMMTRLIQATPTAAAAYTLPTGTLTDTASGMQIGQSFDWTIINLATNAAFVITMTAATGHTIVGNPRAVSNSATTGATITSDGQSSSGWRTRKTAANTFITYRLY
jgi:hypothetical protein